MMRALGLGLAGAIAVAPGVLGATYAAGAAQAQTAPSPAARQIGTVKEVTPNKLSITTDAGLVISVNVVDGARVLQLAPGSTDLKTAQSIALGDIEMGDRVLVTGHADAPDAFTASRVILMKSTDIAQKHAAEQEDWQKRGAGGLVSAVDPASGVVTITVRGRKIAIETTPATVYRRYSDGSVKFEDAVRGTLSQIQVGDQLRVRGSKSDDGSSIKADEIVSGSFVNLAGTIVAIDASANTVTVKDLASKKTYSIKVTPNSNVRALPPEAAARFAARARGTQPGATTASATAPSHPTGGGEAAGAGSGTGSAGGDLSQLLNRLPQGSLGQLHSGDALMVVASQAQAGSNTLTAITLLSGVEPILAATPKGEASMTLSPWNVGSTGVEGGGM
jgi:hypothetical protein